MAILNGAPFAATHSTSARYVLIFGSHCRIYRDPTAFKVVELAQITAAFRMMAFKSPKLNENVSTNVMALPRAQLNVRSLINILHDLARMHWRDKAIFSFLVRPTPPRHAAALLLVECTAATPWRKCEP